MICLFQLSPKVGKNLDKSYQLNDSLPQVDPSAYTQAIEQVQAHLEDIVARAEKIRQLAELLEEIQHRVRGAISRLEVQE